MEPQVGSRRAHSGHRVGGREHAIVRALSGQTDSLHAAPGNPGIAALAETHPDTNPHSPVPDQIVRLARKLSPDLVVIGPEAPLVAGAADALREHGITCFGPDAAAAMIEGLEVLRQAGHDRGRDPDRGLVHLHHRRRGGTGRWPRSGRPTW